MKSGRKKRGIESPGKRLQKKEGGRKIKKRVQNKQKYEHKKFIQKIG